MTLTTTPTRLGYSQTSRRSKLAFHWRAADLSLTPLTGQTATFARTSAGGLVTDVTGRLIAAHPREIPRWAMVDSTGALSNTRDEAALVLEGARTNIALRSEEFDNASWSKSNVSISADAATAPDGTATADGLTSTVGSGDNVSQAITFTGDGDKAVSCFLKESSSGQTDVGVRDSSVGKDYGARITWNGDGTGSAAALADGGTVLGFEALGNGWHHLQVQVTVVAANSNNAILYPDSAGATGSVFAWGYQAEDAASPSTYIATAGSTVTRNADSLYWDFLPVPQAMTVYCKFIEKGTLQTNAGGVLHIGDTGITNARLEIYTNVVTNKYRADFSDGSTTRSSKLTGTAPTYGESVEIRCVLTDAGVVRIHQSIGEAAETSATAAAALALPGAWADTRLYFNSLGSSFPGINDFIDVKVALGAELTMAQMRAAF